VFAASLIGGQNYYLSKELEIVAAEIEFGTDGVRGLHPDVINEEIVRNLAAAQVADWYERYDEPPQLFIGGDTRPSTPALIDAAVKGALEAGAHVIEVGTQPTPVIAWLAKRHGVGAIAITASHNPSGENGFKPFAPGGDKYGRDILSNIEKLYWQINFNGRRHYPGGHARQDHGLATQYVDQMVNKLGGSDVLGGKIVVVDGAYGAAHNLAPQLYRGLGAQVIPFACSTRGKINNNVGAAHLNGVKSFLRKLNLATDPNFLGALSFDGDADRVMGVDAAQREINGNHWLHQLAPGQLGIVGTIYTNSGLEEALAVMGVPLYRSGTGDYQVTTELRKRNLRFGGEPSGHIIDTEHLSSGDGLFIGGRMLADLALREMTMRDIFDTVTLWPEDMNNIRVGGNAKALVDSVPFQNGVRAIEARYDGAVNTIVRASGTEQGLVRVWVEGRMQEMVKDAKKRLRSQLAEYMG